MALEITDTERTAWQRRAALCLTDLLALAAKRHLPVLTWRIGTGPGILGEPAGPDRSRRRADLEAWKAALTTVTGKAPEFDREHVFPGGETRLVAGWKYLPVKHVPIQGPAPGVDVTLAASIWPEEEDEGSGH